MSAEPIPSLSRRIASACRRHGARASVVREVIEDSYEEFVVAVPVLPKNWRTGHRVVWQGELRPGERTVMILKPKVK